jgi:uncharacterized protein DUF6174
VTAWNGWRPALPFGLGVLIGCTENPFGVTEQRALAEARGRWEAASLVDYRVDVRLSCFCIAALPVFTQIEVRDGQVVSAQAVDSVPSPYDIPLDAWPTVPAAFDLIESAANQDVYSDIVVQYDPGLGYPRGVDLDCHPDMLDCGARYEFRNLEPVDSI